MSRITTSWASLSCARLAMRRACSRDVSVASAPFRYDSQSLAVPIEPESRDQLGDGRRHEPVDRFSTADAVPDLLRRDRHRLDLEELDAVRARKSLQDRVQTLRRKPRSGRNTDPRECEHALGILPREEVRELIGPDEKQRFEPPPRAEHVHRALVRIRLDAVVGKGSSRKLQPRLGVEPDLLVSGTLGHEHREVVEIEVLPGRTRERQVSVVRRIERAAEQACHWTSRNSPPTSTSSPLRAPAASSAAASSSSSAGTSPEIRKPRSVRRTLKRRPPG